MSLINRIKQFLATAQKDSVFKRFVKNSGYLLCGNSMVGLLTAIQGILLARILGISGFGMLGIVMSMVTVLGKLYSCRIEEFTITYYSRFHEVNDTQKTCNIIQISYLYALVSAILSIVTIWVAGGGLLKLFMKDSQIESDTLLVFSLSLIFINTSVVAEALLRISDSFAKMALTRILERIVSILIFAGILLLRGTIRLQTVIIVLIIGSGIRCITAQYYVLPQLTRFCHRWYRTSLAYSKTHFREYLSFLLQSGLSSLVSNVTRGADELWIGFFATPAAVGIYKIAMSVSCFVLLPINQFTSSAFPEISRLAATKSIEKLRLNLRRMSLTAFIYFVPVFLFCCFMGVWLIGILYGQDFTSARQPLIYLLIGTGFAGIFFWGRPLLLSTGLIRIALYINLVTMTLKILLMPALVTRYEEMGAAICVMICSLFAVTLSIIFGMKQLRLFSKNEDIGLRPACA